MLPSPAELRPGSPASVKLQAVTSRGQEFGVDLHARWAGGFVACAPTGTHVLDDALAPVASFGSLHAAVLPGGRALAIHERGGVRIVALPGREPVRVFPPPPGTRLDPTLTTSMAVSLDGRSLVVATYQKVALFDVDPRVVIDADPEIVDGVAFHPSSELLVTRRGDRVTVFRVATGERIAQLAGLAPVVGDLFMTPDGALLVTPLDPTRIGVFETSRWTCVRTLGPTPRARAFALSSDGMLASGGQAAEVRLWGLATGALVGVLLGPTSWVRSVAFSSDGRRLLAGADHRIHVWDADARAQMEPAAPELDARIRRRLPPRDEPLTLERVRADVETMAAFGKLGQATEHDGDVARIDAWDEWAGPEDPLSEELATVLQAARTAVDQAVRTFGRTDVAAIVDGVERRAHERARAHVGASAADDPWDPPSACAWELAFVAGTIAGSWRSAGPSRATSTRSGGGTNEATGRARSASGRDDARRISASTEREIGQCSSGSRPSAIGSTDPPHRGGALQASDASKPGERGLRERRVSADSLAVLATAPLRDGRSLADTCAALQATSLRLGASAETARFRSRILGRVLDARSCHLAQGTSGSVATSME